MIGESQAGSWPIHTPLETSAATVQPTEQNVQMFLRMVTSAPGCRGGAASDLRMLASGSVTEGGEAAGDEAGAAQEGAAIDAAFSLGLQRVCKRAAAHLIAPFA